MPLTLTLVSAGSMALEIVAGRALAPYVGMSLYTWTVIIAVVLAGLSLGHWWGGRLADRTARPARMVAAILLGASIVTLISLALMRLLAPWAAGFDPVGHAGALALSAFFLPSLMAGAVSPLLTVMALDAAPAERRGGVLGLMFALGAGGAIIGTLLAGLVLISWLGTALSVAGIAGLYAVLSVPFLGGARRSAGVLLAAVAVVAGGTGAFGLATACRIESAYYCIRVDDILSNDRPARVLALDHLGHGVNDARDPELLHVTYVHGVDEMVARRLDTDAPHAFFIGGGAYTLPRAWAARWPDGHYVVAEIDVEVTAAARDLLWLDAGIETVHADARRALRDLPPETRFDVIFGDAFHDISVPPHLVTDEFHAQIRARLAPGGVYAINVIDALRAPAFTLSLVATLERRFPHVELWIDLAEIGPDEKRTTWIVLASDRPSGAGEIRARRGLPRIWVQVPASRLASTLPEGAIITLTDDYTPVDRLLGDVLLSAGIAG